MINNKRSILFLDKSILAGNKLLNFYNSSLAGLASIYQNYAPSSPRQVKLATNIGSKTQFSAQDNLYQVASVWNNKTTNISNLPQKITSMNGSDTTKARLVTATEHFMAEYFSAKVLESLLSKTDRLRRSAP